MNSRHTHIMEYQWINKARSMWITVAVLLAVGAHLAEACIIYSRLNHDSEAEGVRFVRVREDMPVGTDILTLRAYPRDRIKIRAIERTHDHKYFRLRELNDTYVQVLLDQSIDDLVDRDVPQNLLKFKVECASRTDETSQLAVTVYIEDINDHTPVFQSAPYSVTIDEATPVGTTIFQGIAAFDRDKPNTPNSDVQFTLGGAAEAAGAFFAVESPHRPSVVLRRSLDFDEGVRRFEIPIIAMDRGVVPNLANTTLTVIVEDSDDLPPRFTEGVYRTKINEFYPITGAQIHETLHFEPPIHAYDQDSLNATLAYDIIAGNERGLFSAHSRSGHIYLNKEIDLEDESLPGNTFVLQLEARQLDSAQMRAVARIEIEILDLNDNAPEFEVDVYNISIVENLPSGFSVLQVQAIDRDQGENAEFTYQISEETPSGAFVVDARSGWITVRDQELLDRERRTSITMSIRAVEREQPYREREAGVGVVLVEVTLLDSNDNTPEFEMGNLYEFRVNVDAVLGTVVGVVRATDPDEGRNGMVFYELQHPRGSGTVPFRLDTSTGELQVSGPLRRGRLAVFVEASDQPVNPSERRFSLAVVTVEIYATRPNEVVDFVGAPYEFWVGADVPVGASVGQIRTNWDGGEADSAIMFDLLHSYAEGVPFAVEERSGIVTVIRELEHFKRSEYEFEAVAAHGAQLRADVELRKRSFVRPSATERRISDAEDMYELDEGTISDSENVLVTNVTIHVVGADDERGILRRGTYDDPIEFHVKENQAGVLIGQLLYMNYSTTEEERRSIEVVQSTVSTTTTATTLSGRRDLFSSKSARARLPYSRSLRNATTTASTVPQKLTNYIRRHRDTEHDSAFFVAITPNVYFEQGFESSLPDLNRIGRAEPLVRRRRFKPKARTVDSRTRVQYESRSSTTVAMGDVVSNEVSAEQANTTTTVPMHPITEKTTTTTTTKEPVEVHITPRSIASQRNAKQHTNLVVIKPAANDTAARRSLAGADSRVPHLRFVIANQPDVTDQIAITDDGTLKTVGPLDRELRDTYRLTVLAEYSRGSVSGAGIYQVVVHVDDVNDNAPQFGRGTYAGIIAENSALGTEVYLNQPLVVHDADAGDNANFTVRLVGEHSDLFSVVRVEPAATRRADGADEKLTKLQRYFPNLPQFFVDPHSAAVQAADGAGRPHYAVRFRGPTTLDRERTAFYGLRVIATDRGGLSSEARLDVSVADVNDNAPSIERIAVLRGSGVRILDASNYINTFYVQRLVGANEADPLSLEDQNAAGTIIMDAGDGVDAMDDGVHDTDGSMPQPLSKRTIVGTPRLLKHQTRRSSVDRLDQMTAGMAMHSFAMPENVTLARAVLQITAVDDDLEQNARVSYRIISERLVTVSGHDDANVEAGDHHFAINTLTGELQLLRRPPAESHIYVNVSASDLDGLADHVLLKFEVEDVNDHTPQFQRPWYTFDLNEGDYAYDAPSALIGEIVASDADFGANANLTYAIVADAAVPFRIHPQTGVLNVSGPLDRELVQRYEFRIRATDAGVPMSRSATTEVEVNVLDVNDNAPEFTGYDDVVLARNPLVPTLDVLANVAVYKVYLQRNTEPGTVVREIRAVDRDFAGNGNGLVMYALMQPPQWPAFFQIDSREGTVTTVQRFHRHRNYEHFNVTLVATDLGSPSMTTSAVMLVNVQGWDEADESEESASEGGVDDDGNDADSDRLFMNRYFEVEVEENSAVPMQLLQLNVSARYRDDPFKWSIVAAAEEEPIYEAFYLDPRNGSVWLMRALDRELRDLYSMRVRADRVVRDGRNMLMANIVYPIRGDRMRDLRENEVRLVIRVLDVNDNSPRFAGNGKPIISVIPGSANFGFPVTNVRATDADAGVNADIRYTLLNEPSGLFGIDAHTGHIRVLRPVDDDEMVAVSSAAASGEDAATGQRVYGFDVKATDRSGASDGRSAIANVFVYVLDESKQVRLVVAGRPAEVEQKIDGLMRTLSDATELDVRVRILEPHAQVQHGQSDDPATNAYIYAVDPRSNAIVDMNILQSIMQQVSAQNISSALQIIELVDVAGLAGQLPRHGANGTISVVDGADLGSTAAASAELQIAELASIILGVIVFAGSLSTAICVVCVRYRRLTSRHQHRRRDLVGGSRHRGEQLGNAAYSIANDSPSTIRALSKNSSAALALAHPKLEPQHPQQASSGVTSPVPATAVVALSRRSSFVVGAAQQKHLHLFPEHAHVKHPTRSRVYMDVPLPKSVHSSNQHLDRDPCLRYNQIQHTRPHNLDTSVTSLHSSGHDSGLDLSREHTAAEMHAHQQQQLQPRPPHQHQHPLRGRKITGASGRSTSSATTASSVICCSDHECMAAATAIADDAAVDSSDSYEDSLKNVKMGRRTSLPRNQHGFRRSFRINVEGRSGGSGAVAAHRPMRHSFSAGNPQFYQHSADGYAVERRAVRRPGREPFHLNNSAC